MVDVAPLRVLRNATDLKVANQRAGHQMRFSNRVLKRGPATQFRVSSLPAIMNLHERNWCLSPFFSNLLSSSNRWTRSRSATSSVTTSRRKDLTNDSAFQRINRTALITMKVIRFVDLSRSRRACLFVKENHFVL
jgi:hypothetical protein